MMSGFDGSFIDVELLIYAIGLPLLSYMAYREGKKHSTSAIIISVILFSAIIALYVFAITYPHPVRGEYGESWILMFIVLLESVLVCAGLLVGAARSLSLSEHA
jgi:MFS family permease